MLHKILLAAGHVKSFRKASTVINHLSEFYISPKHVNRLTQEIGRELAEQRDRRTEDYLHHRRAEPTEAAPVAAAVALDGGRILTRETDQGAGVHHQQWKEDKVACLHKLEGPTFTEDPQPEPAACFLDAPYVDEMVREIQANAGKRQENELPQLQELGLGSPSSGSTEPGTSSDTKQEKDWPPKRKGRTCVATMASSEDFGKMVAAEAYRHGLTAAERRAFLGDGSKWIWTIQKKWFKEFTAITDFVHPLTYLYVTATALSSSIYERWQRYVGWMTLCWQGRCAEVIADMELRLQELGGADENAPRTDPRQVLRRTITYLGNNCARMNYPEHRRNGLPVTSSAVESLIKEINQRVKGTEKFWNRPAGAEAILQVRAALLSDDDELARHLAERSGSSFRRPRQNG